MAVWVSKTKIKKDRGKPEKPALTELKPNFTAVLNYYFAASGQNSNIAIIFSYPDFLKMSNNLAIR